MGVKSIVCCPGVMLTYIFVKCIKGIKIIPILFVEW